MSARVEMEFVGDFQGIERLVQFARAAVEAVGVLRAAIEINFRLCKHCRVFPCQQERTVQLPEFLVNRISENIGEYSRRRIPRRRARVHALRRITHQRGAMCAYRPKQFGVGETDPQRAVASHGKSADSPGSAARADTIGALDIRHELAEEEITVESLAITGIDVERVPSVRSDHQEVSDLVIPPQILEFRPFSGNCRRLLISSQSVQEVQNGIPLGLRLWSGIACRQKNAITDGGIQDSAVKGAAIRALLREGARSGQ